MRGELYSEEDDKRKHIDNLASQAEDAASRGEQSRVYKITELVCGRYRRSTEAPIMDHKPGQLLSKKHNGQNTSVKFLTDHQQRQIYRGQRPTWTSTLSPQEKRRS